jgi:hypothetical protein
MPFKLSKSQTFRTTVTIESVDEKGRTQKETVQCTWARPTEEELDAYTGKENKEALGKFLLNVEGMMDEDGNDVPYEGTYRDAFLSYSPATFACAASFWQAARMGRVKN